MSFINEALKKAQEEKNNRYYSSDAALQTATAATESRHRPWRLKTAIALVLVLSVSLAFAVFWHGNFIKSATRSNQIVKSVGPVSANRKPAEEATRLYMDALNHQRSGDYIIAETLYHQVIALDPQHVYTLNNLGVLNMIQKKPDQAIVHFQRAIALKNDYVHPYYNLACLYAQQHNAPESLRHLQAALSLKPDLKDWVEKDGDLRNIRGSDGYKKLMSKQTK